MSLMHESIKRLIGSSGLKNVGRRRSLSVYRRARSEPRTAPDVDAWVSNIGPSPKLEARPTQRRLPSLPELPAKSVMSSVELVEDGWSF